MERKTSINLNELYINISHELKKYIDYIRAMGFGDKPDYSRLRRIFRNLLVRRGYLEVYGVFARAATGGKLGSGTGVRFGRGH